MKLAALVAALAGLSGAPHANIEGTTVVKSSQNSAGRARDGQIAIREEFDAALRAGTRDALIAFLARHPQHALSDDVRARLAKPVGAEAPKGAIPPIGPDPERGVRYAFDAALIAGTDAAYETFLSAHPHHPLAAEIRRLQAD